MIKINGKYKESRVAVDPLNDNFANGVGAYHLSNTPELYEVQRDNNFMFELNLTDNGLLPLEAPEIAIKRRLYRSGEQEYFINNRIIFFYNSNIHNFNPYKLFKIIYTEFPFFPSSERTVKLLI